MDHGTELRAPRAKLFLSFADGADCDGGGRRRWHSVPVGGVETAQRCSSLAPEPRCDIGFGIRPGSMIGICCPCWHSFAQRSRPSPSGSRTSSHAGLHGRISGYQLADRGCECPAVAGKDRPKDFLILVLCHNGLVWSGASPARARRIGLACHRLRAARSPV